jgi:hypothetical protein
MPEVHTVLDTKYYCSLRPYEMWLFILLAIGQGARAQPEPRSQYSDTSKQDKDKIATLLETRVLYQLLGLTYCQLGATLFLSHMSYPGLAAILILQHT